MRIRIIFRLRNKGAYLPFQHQHLLLNLVESTLHEKLSELKNQLSWNFSGIKGQTKVGRLGLSYLSSRVTLVMSSPSQLLIDTFLDELFKQTLIEIGEIILTPEFVEQEITTTFYNAEKYLCLSPLVPSTTIDTNGVENFLSPELLSDILYDSTMYRMEKSGAYSSEEIEQFYQFQLIPDKEYLQKIQGIEKKAGRAYSLYENGKIVQEIIGYTFPFELYAHPRVQEFIFTNGFGEFTQAGYGMLDKATNLAPNRIVPYRAATS